MAISLNVLRDLVCPTCNSPLDSQPPAVAGGLPDALSCNKCGKTYPVSPTMVSFVPDLKDIRGIASTFGFEWKAFWRGLFDTGDVFGLQLKDTSQYFLSSMGLQESDVAGLTVLDAGTGSGRIPISLRDARCRVFGVDIHDSLGDVAERFKDTTAACFFHADLFALPFRDGFFDLGWSSGVIHHTPDPGKAFAAIARKLKPGGRLFVSVYGKDLHHYRLLRRLLPFARYLPAFLTFGLSVVIAAVLFVVFNSALAVIRLVNTSKRPPYRFLGFTVENITFKSYRSILLNLFDQLHPRYQSEHSVDEVTSWFVANGFQELAVVESVGMVGIRGLKKRSA